MTFPMRYFLDTSKIVKFVKQQVERYFTKYGSMVHED